MDIITRVDAVDDLDEDVDDEDDEDDVDDVEEVSSAPFRLPLTGIGMYGMVQYQSESTVRVRGGLDLAREVLKC